MIASSQLEARPTGRPPAYTQAIADEILERIALGQSLVSICKRDHMPGMSTVFRWLSDDIDSFRERYTDAREAQAETMADELVDISDSEPDDTNVNRHKLRIETRKWVAAKLLPKKYGERMTIEGEIKISVSAALNQATARVIEGQSTRITTSSAELSSDSDEQV